MTNTKTNSKVALTATHLSTSKLKKLNSNSRIYKAIITAMQDKKAEKILSLDMRAIDVSVADYFIICEAQSYTQIHAIAQHIEEEIEELIGEKVYHKEYGQHWTLLDYVNIVVHIFDREQRKFYDIEGLWADANHQEIESFT